MIRPLGEEDLEAYVALRRRSLEESPLAFGASPEDDVASSIDHLRAQLRNAPDWMLFGAFPGAELAGAVGLIRQRRAKAAHRIDLWGMYVAPQHRAHGLGRALLEACIAHARSLPGVARIELAVTDEAAAAGRLYERAGFVTWGTHPDSFRHEGRSTADRHMSLLLTESSENASV